jgi:hypothetical protein
MHRHKYLPDLLSVVAVAQDAPRAEVFGGYQFSMLTVVSEKLSLPTALRSTAGTVR